MFKTDARYQNFFDFLLEVGKEYGFTALIIVFYTFCVTFLSDKYARWIVKEKQGEIDRMAEEKRRLEEFILGELRMSSKSQKRRGDDNE